MNRSGKKRGFVSRWGLGGLLTAALLAVSFSLSFFSGAALAHAAFARSQPAPNSVLTDPPGAVTIWFTEAVDPGLGKISVLDSNGKSLTNEPVTALTGDPKTLTVNLPRLPNGVYTIVWSAFSSVDGHSLSGSFVFSVGVPLPVVPAQPTATAPTQPLIESPFELVMRWLRLLSLLAIAGCLAFDLFITRHVLGVDNASEDMRSMDSRMESRTLSFAVLAAGIFLIASVGELFARTSAATGFPLIRTFGTPAASVLRSDWGNLWIWRIAVTFGMIIVLTAAVRDRSKRKLSGGREWEMVALTFAAGILFTIGLTTHGAATREIRTAAIFSSYLHMLAAAFWTGGISYMALILPPVMKAHRKRAELTQDSGQKVSYADIFCPANHVKAIGRFSTLAMLSVGTLFITGLFNSWAQVTVLPALATPYGTTLLAKLGLVVPLLLLSAVNLLWVRPRLAHEPAALQVLRKTATAQAVLSVLIAMCVGVLVGLEPAREVIKQQATVQANRLTLQSTSEGVNFKTIIQPGKLGTNLVTVFLTDRSGQAVNATRVNLQLTYLDGDLAPFSEDTLSHGGGIWVARHASFSVAGNWQASLTVQRPDDFDADTSYRFKIPITATGTTIELSTETGRRLWGIELALLGVLFGGVGLYSGGRKTKHGMTAITLAAIAIVAGAILVSSTLG